MHSVEPSIVRAELVIVSTDSSSSTRMIPVAIDASTLVVRTGEVLSVEMVFDDTDARVPSEGEPETLLDVLRPRGSIDGSVVCELRWADTVFRGTVGSCSKTDQLLDEDGNAVRTHVSLELRDCGATRSSIGISTMERRTLPGTYRFVLTIDGLGEGGGRARAHFAEMSGLGLREEVIEYRDGRDPGTTKAAPGATTPSLTLRRGVTEDTLFFDWIRCPDRAAAPPSDGIVALVDESGAEVVRWRIHQALPVTVTFPRLGDGSGGTVIEELGIAHAGVEVES